MPWFDPGGHKPSILTPLDSLDNLLLHPPAQPGDMVLVDKPSVRGHKLRKELGVLVIWLRATARGKSSWTQDASRRCWTVRVLHGDRHVCFRGCLDRVLQLVLRLLPSIFGVSSPRQWGSHHHWGLLPPRPLRYDSQHLKILWQCISYLSHGLSFKLWNIPNSFSNSLLMCSRDRER